MIHVLHRGHFIGAFGELSLDLSLAAVDMAFVFLCIAQKARSVVFAALVKDCVHRQVAGRALPIVGGAGLYGPVLRGLLLTLSLLS